MKSVQERPLIVADRRCPLTGPNRLLELPYVNPHQFRIEPQLSSCREDDIAAQRMSDRVDRLIERVLCPRAGAFRPEVGLDPVAREDRKSTRLNSSHLVISYAVFCLKKKKANKRVLRVRIEHESLQRTAISPAVHRVSDTQAARSQ